MPTHANIPIAATIPEVIQSLTPLPRSDIETPIEFKIPQRHMQIIPPKSIYLQYRIHVQRKLVNGRLVEIDTSDDFTDNICLVNLAGMTNFNQVEIFLNGELITRNSYNHGLTAYFRADEEYTLQEKELELTSAGWEPDIGQDLINEKRQAQLFKNNGVMEFTTPVLVDCLRHNVPFPDDVDILFRFHRAPVQWVINGQPPQGQSYEITFIKANMLITRLQMESGQDVYRAFGGTLNANYIRNEYRHFVLPPHITTINEEIFNGIQPFKTTILFVNQDGYNGSHAHNPFNFEHHLVKRVNLKRDEMHNLPPSPYEFELDTSKAYERHKRSLTDEVGGPPSKRSKGSRVKRGTGGGGGETAATSTTDFTFERPPPPSPPTSITSANSFHQNVVNQMRGVLPVLAYVDRPFKDMMKARGRHHNTNLKPLEWLNGKFHQCWDLRADPDEESDDKYVQQPKCSMRYQSEHHREITKSIVLLTRNQHQTMLQIKKGGVIGHV